MRKSQINLFIIFGLVILIVFGFISYLTNQKKEKITKPTATDLSMSLRNYVDECVKSSAREAVFGTALQGGFYNETANSLAYSFFVVPYYSYVNTKLTPSLHKLEEQIAFSAEDSTLACIDNFRIFDDFGFKIEYEKPHYKTKILDDYVFLETNFPITVISQGRPVKSFDKFSTSVPSRYKLIYVIADQIASLQAQKPDKVCVSCLIDYASGTDLNISVANFNDNSIIISIVDRKINVKDEPFIFNFAHSTGDLVA